MRPRTPDESKNASCDVPGPQTLEKRYDRRTSLSPWRPTTAWRAVGSGTRRTGASALAISWASRGRTRTTTRTAWRVAPPPPAPYARVGVCGDEPARADGGDAAPSMGSRIRAAGECAAAALLGSAPADACLCERAAEAALPPGDIMSPTTGRPPSRRSRRPHDAARVGGKSEGPARSAVRGDTADPELG